MEIVQDNYNDMASKRVTEKEIANRSKLLNRIAGDLLIPPVFGLQIVHTSDYYKGKGYMYGSLSNHRNLFNWLGFDMCFPSGTAIANARQFAEITSALPTTASTWPRACRATSRRWPAWRRCSVASTRG